MLRLERHALGPRVYVLRRRIHEYHLGLAILLVLAVGAALDWLRYDLAAALAAVAGVWLVAKDWRDLIPSQRDTAACIGARRRFEPCVAATSCRRWPRSWRSRPG